MSKGTPTRSIGIDDELWEEAKVVAARRSDTVTEVIRGALQRYVAEVSSAPGRRARPQADSDSGPRFLSVFEATTTTRVHLDRADTGDHGRTFEPGLSVTAVPMGGQLWHLTAVAEGYVWVGLGSSQEIVATTLLTTIKGNDIS
ncbi:MULTISPECIES: hypothetical protein [unclassified Arthrobacter]|uniref:hypothetical protein n=1 Tax=unclassified Arthrobacter TaxID=235627 RepID=UPI001DED6D38|nr:hypothetical protein [Arthrobacter sp. Bi26]CAH0256299.1 hypothetical protein SRABI26_03275 [Arthrobacter sp. Bi26]